MSGRERIVLGVMIGVVLLWMSSQWTGLDVTMVAFAGLAVLLVSDVLRWEGALAERNAWDVFVWYGGLLTMGEALNKTGSTTAFATWVGAWFGQLAVDGRAARDADRLLLRALRLRQHHRAHAGDVSAVRHDADRPRHAAGARRLRARLHGEPHRRA